MFLQPFLSISPPHLLAPTFSFLSQCPCQWQTSPLKVSKLQQCCYEMFCFDLALFTLFTLKLSHYTPWRRLGGEELQLLLILDLGTRWGWVVSITPWPHFSPRERTPGTHWIGGCVGSRDCLDTVARGKILSPLPEIEPRWPSRPVCSQTLYWLSYLAHVFFTYCSEIKAWCFGIRHWSFIRSLIPDQICLQILCSHIEACISSKDKTLGMWRILDSHHGSEYTSSSWSAM
jgi:hypothetical protein